MIESSLWEWSRRGRNFICMAGVIRKTILSSILAFVVFRRLIKKVAFHICQMRDETSDQLATEVYDRRVYHWDRTEQSSSNTVTPWHFTGLGNRPFWKVTDRLHEVREEVEPPGWKFAARRWSHSRCTWADRVLSSSRRKRKESTGEVKAVRFELNLFQESFFHYIREVSIVCVAEVILSFPPTAAWLIYNI